jgi:hypothetical protein
MSCDGAQTFSDHAGGRLRIDCERCGRAGAYSVDKLIAERATCGLAISWTA